MSGNLTQKKFFQFRQRFLEKKVMLGTFIKTPSTQPTEILGDIGFDFVVIDQEHGPFDRASTDTVLLAARAADIAAIVRVPSDKPADILAVLDSGASGILVPHVKSAEIARSIVAASRHRGGSRGFSPTTRAGRYGSAKMKQHIADQDSQVTVIAMIEDPEALEVLDEIAAVEGLDGVFIGRGDLTVALGAENNVSPPVMDAVKAITAAMEASGKVISMMADDSRQAREFQAFGASAFIVASDQGLMRQAAARMRADFTELAAGKQIG